MEKPKTQPAQITKTKMSLSQVIPLLLVVGCLAVATLHLGGVINLSGFLNPDSENYLNLHNVLNPTTGPNDQNPLEFSMPPDAGSVKEQQEKSGGTHAVVCEGETIYDIVDGEVGKQYNAKLSATVTGGNVKGSVKFFIIDEWSGAPPPGIKLYPDGTLSGVPTKSGSYDFEVCAEDEDTGDCVCIRIFIRPKKQETKPVPAWCFPCPTHSCDTGECCCEIKDGIRKSGMIVLDCCANCPNDTREVGKDVKTTPGTAYKICKCNKC